MIQSPYDLIDKKILLLDWAIKLMLFHDVFYSSCQEITALQILKSIIEGRR